MDVLFNCDNKKGDQVTVDRKFADEVDLFHTQHLWFRLNRGIAAFLCATTIRLSIKGVVGAWQFRVSDN